MDFVATLLRLFKEAVLGHSWPLTLYGFLGQRMRTGEEKIRCPHKAMRQGPVRLHVLSSLALPPAPFSNLAQPKLPGTVPSLVPLALSRLRLSFPSSHCHKIRRAGHLFNNFFDPLCKSQHNPGTEEGLKNKFGQLKRKRHSGFNVRVTSTKWRYLYLFFLPDSKLFLHLLQVLPSFPPTDL